ncbi:hypothetical protein MPER_13053, partial [Moniliophthora perniciosa FA553]
VNILTTYRRNGWGIKGLRAHGLIYSHVKIGGYNGEEFTQWLEGLLEVMNPYPGPRSVLVLDNCRIHHVPGIEEMCEERAIYVVMDINLEIL